MSSHPYMLNFRQVVRPLFVALSLFFFTAAPAMVAQTQNFSLTPSVLSPQSGVDPGGQATGTIALTAVTPGFASPVTLACTVTSNEVTNLPVCTVSPTVAIPNATVSLTISALGDTVAGQYTITITGTAGAEVETAAPVYFNVVDVPQDYTLSVTQAISPSTVTPGGGAKATVTVTPIAGYTGSVTLSCLSVTPVVVAAPICSFNAVGGSGGPTVSLANGSAGTSILTISTYGNTQSTAEVWTPPIFYGLWLAFPGLALMGAGARGSQKKKWLGLFLLMVVAGLVILLPACNSTTSLSSTSNNSSGFVTPKNSYTFTLTGVDQNGISPSNTSTPTGTGAATVSLTVN